MSTGEECDMLLCTFQRWAGFRVVGRRRRVARFCGMRLRLRFITSFF